MKAAHAMVFWAMSPAMYVTMVHAVVLNRNIEDEDLIRGFAVLEEKFYNVVPEEAVAAYDEDVSETGDCLFWGLHHGAKSTGVNKRRGGKSEC